MELPFIGESLQHFSGPEAPAKPCVASRGGQDVSRQPPVLRIRPASRTRTTRKSLRITPNPAGWSVAATRRRGVDSTRSLGSIVSGLLRVPQAHPGKGLDPPGVDPATGRVGHERGGEAAVGLAVAAHRQRDVIQARIAGTLQAESISMPYYLPDPGPDIGDDGRDSDAGQHTPHREPDSWQPHGLPPPVDVL